MSNLAAQPDAPSDAELISRVRAGDQAAYGQLFERHREAARRMARQLVRGHDADDLISEAFTKVLVQLQQGGGPDVAFRAYLLTAIRRLHVDRARTNQRVQVTDDLGELDQGVDFVDPATSDFERGAASRAFASLPERWQLVLWHLEVEGQKPADIAPLLGMSPNSVAALAYRAREGLRQAYLQSHLADTADDSCRWTTEHLGAYVRNGLAKRDSAKVQAHLNDCHRCTAVYLELTEVNSNLSGLLAPALLGLAAPGYLAAGGAKIGLLLLWPWTKLKDAGAGAQAGAAAAAVTAIVAVAAIAGVFGGGDDADEVTEPPTQQTAPDTPDSPPDDQQNPDTPPDEQTPPDNQTPPVEDEPPLDQAPPDEAPPPDDTPPVETPDPPTDFDGNVRGSNVVLNWDPVDGARGYKVYRKTSPAATAASAALATDVAAPATAASYTVAASYSAVPAAAPRRGIVISDGLIQQTSFRDTSLVDGNTYRYVVTAVANGEESTVSDPVTVTYDPVPEAPARLRTRERDAGIALRWAANSEPDIDGYRVLRDGDEIGTSPSPRFVDDSAVDGSTYSYAVIAIDRSGQESPESGAVSATYDPVPSAPSGLEAKVRGSNVRLRWDKSAEPDISHYTVYRDGQLLEKSVTTRHFVDRDPADGPANYTVTAVDDSGQESDESDTVGVDPVPDAPTGVVAVEGEGAIELSWDANTESDITGYVVVRDGEELNTDPVTKPRYSDTDVVDGQTYRYRVIAVDQNDNRSKPSRPAKAAYDPAPGAPTGLTAELHGERVKLDWKGNPEPDIDHYEVYRNGTPIDTDVTLSAYTAEEPLDGKNVYTVIAVDESGQESAPSDSETIDPVPDVPTGLTAVEVEGAIELDWYAGTEADVGEYNVYRDGVKIDTAEQSNYADQNPPAGDITYAVTAVDESGQESGRVNITVDRPEPPTALTAVEGHGGINLSWDASAGNVSEYVVYRDGTEIARTGSTRAYFDGSALGGVPYAYTVVATGKNGPSEPSAEVSTSWAPPPEPTGLTCEQSGGTLTFSWDQEREPASTYVARLDGAPLDVDGREASVGGHGGAAIHTLTVTAIDQVGNESKTAEQTFYHDVPGDIVGCKVFGSGLRQPDLIDGFDLS